MKKIRIVSLFLAILMALTAFSCFVGCEDNGTGDDTTEPEDTTNNIKLELLAQAVATYTIVRPDEISDTLLTAVQGFNTNMREIFGNNLLFKSDFYMENVPAFAMVDTEILIGKTNRKESIEFLADLNRDDYGYKLIGTKLVIAGNTDEGTIAAIQRFQHDILSKLSAGQSFGESDIFYTSANDYLSVAEYPVKNLSIGSVSVNDYRIVYPHKGERGEELGAELLAEKIADICGAVVDVVSDKKERGEQAHEILIGATNRSSEAELSAALDSVAANVGVVVYTDKDILIHASGATALLTAVNGLIDKLPAEKAESVSITLEAKSEYSYNDKLLSAMSFNVQVWGTSTDRDARVKKMLATYKPDTIGFQEVDTDWLGKLNAFLKSEYDFVGLGRDGGTKGEFNPIFYKKDLFKCIEYGTKWLSDTPDVKSKYSESSLNRIYTYALLERKSDGQRIMVINTHFDHESGVAREKQANALMKYVNTITDYPVVLTGDFNCGASSKAYNNIVSSGMLKNSSGIAGNVITKGPTYTDYGSSNSTIDFVFVTHKKILVESYRVCNEKINGNYPSDHHPVLIEYSIY